MINFMSLGNVIVGTPKIRHNNFDFGHSVDVTNSFGRLKCIHFKKVNAGTKSTLKTESVTRLAPLANPSFGKLYMKTYFQFVGLSEVYPKAKHFLAQLPRLNSDTTNPSTPVKMPTINASILNWYLMKYSWLELFAAPVDGSPVSFWNGGSSLLQESTYMNFPKPTERPNFSVVDELVPRFVMSANSGLSRPAQNLEHIFDPTTADLHVSRRGSESNTTSRHIFAKFTKRALALKDSFVAAGCVPTNDNSISYNFLHLIALYKAYYDIMLAPITSYESFEYTACAQLIKYFDVTAGSLDFDWNMDEHKKQMLDAFMIELSQLYYTANVDFLSAHMPVDFLNIHSDLGISSIDSHELKTYNGVSANQASIGGRLGNFPTLNTTINFESYSPEASHNTVIFSQYQDDWLKKMFYLINSRSKVGYDLQKELRLRGYSDWVDDKLSRYIGNTRYLLPISEVISTADTTGNGGEGTAQNKRQTGDYSGQSSTRNKGDVFYHTANEEGFIIGFNCVVPDLKVTNGATDDALSFDTTTWYNYLTDSLGYVGTPRICIGFQDYDEHADVNHVTQMSSVFGLIPRHFGKKLHPNLRLGSASLLGEQTTWNSMFIDRWLVDHPIGRGTTTAISGTSVTWKTDSWKSGVNYNTLIPNSGERWRQFAAIPVCDQFDKIFYFNGDDPVNRVADDSKALPLDNFISHFDVIHSASAPMLASAMSYPTYDDESDDNTMTIEQ